MNNKSWSITIQSRNTHTVIFFPCLWSLFRFIILIYNFEINFKVQLAVKLNRTFETAYPKKANKNRKSANDHLLRDETAYIKFKF